MPEFCLPDLGEGLTEAQIVGWMVAPGDRVRVDQPVVEVETAKAVVEVPVPFAGTVDALHGAPGDSVAVGAPLISVGGPDVAESGRPASEGTEAGSGNVLVGYGTSETVRRRRRPTVEPVESAPTPPTPLTEATLPAPPVISPVVRQLARDQGVDLRLVTGSGPGGVIRRADVEKAISERHVPLGGAERRPLSGIRKAIGQKMARSRRDIPEATTWVDVDATELVAAHASTQVTLLGFLGRFAVAALRTYPELNGRLDGDDLVVPEHVHLGFAAQTERGLVVPVVRHAEALSARRLGARIRELTAAARAGRATPEDLTGGTFTINNYGIFGVDGSAPIINAPEVAMLGIGRILDRPWVVEGQVVPRKIVQLSLVFDHRVCDGDIAGGFLRTVADFIESPVAALAEL